MNRIIIYYETFYLKINLKSLRLFIKTVFHTGHRTLKISVYDEESSFEEVISTEIDIENTDWAIFYFQNCQIKLAFETETVTKVSFILLAIQSNINLCPVQFVFPSRYVMPIQ